MIADKSQIKRILVITLSNVGDIILTTPVISTLKNEFPGARIDVLVGPQGKDIFEKDPAVIKLMIYDKHSSLAAKRRIQLRLKNLRYDMVVDLKNTIFPLLISPKYRTSTVQRFPAPVVHSMDRHLYRLKSLGVKDPQRRPYIYIPAEDDEYISGLLKSEGVPEPMVVVNAAAKSHLKRWMPEGFAEVCDRLAGECKASIIMIGLKEDADIVAAITARMKTKPFNFVGKTNIRQLASLLKRSRLLITNDSAPLHLGCAVGTKVLAIFGPTDPKKYGPTGELDSVINTRLHCSPCERAECRFNHECMKLISADEVFDTARMMLEGYG
ncbi:MAG: glycosyltransferase family 9 protein [Candidatus Omnitrophica bacterium]|nr:glycosyltransferase family 9 protein [Candidatus Omnitrophota bacterium]MCM8790934.1 glycosyltransferase family 9 protein [Candidatus Omnitrophota bacterium]